VEEPVGREALSVGAALHGHADYVQQRRAQLLELRGGEAPADGLRMQAGVEEHLVGHPVAHARHERLLVEEQRLDRAALAADHLRPAHGIDRVDERVGRERAPRVLVQRIGAQPQAAEASRVAEGERRALLKAELHLAEARRPYLVVHLKLLELQRRDAAHDKGARHAKVGEQVRWRREHQPQLLATAPYLDKPLALERLRNRRRRGFAVVKHDAVELAFARAAATFDSDRSLDFFAGAVCLQHRARRLDLG